MNDSLHAGRLYVFHRMIPLRTTRIDDVGDDINFQHAFVVASTEKSFKVYADSWNEKHAWIEALRKAISDIQKENPSNALTSPVWTSNSEVYNCMVCGEPFGNMRRRKHHCR